LLKKQPTLSGETRSYLRSGFDLIAVTLALGSSLTMGAAKVPDVTQVPSHLRGSLAVAPSLEDQCAFMIMWATMSQDGSAGVHR
jgi:hypothetical protein